APASGYATRSAAASVAVAAWDDHRLYGVSLNGRPMMRVSGNVWTQTVWLVLGTNAVSVVARDSDNNATTQTVLYVRKDTAPPVVEEIRPADGFSAEDSAVEMAVVARDTVGVRSVTINGVSATRLADAMWTHSLALSVGLNPVTVVVTDHDDNSTTNRLVYNRGLRATRYVAPGGAHIFPFTNWATAANMIQTAVDVALPGDTVWVSNGTYQAGGAVLPGKTQTNRVMLARAITVRSVNGAAVTIIRGERINSPFVRCAYVGNGAQLIGVTLTNGCVVYTEGAGGAYLVEGALLKDCIVSGNKGGQKGGGVYCDGGGVVQNCELIGNGADYISPTHGGGAYLDSGGTLLNCRITGNSAHLRGGGLYTDRGGVIRNCTISDNQVTTTAGSPSTHYSYGGGVYSVSGGVLYNSIIYSNRSLYASNYYQDLGGYYYRCCLYPPFANNIGDVPRFVNPAAGDYRLQPSSPCINAGSNAYVTADVDLDGRPRMLGGRVDMGAYEFAADSAGVAAPAVTQLSMVAVSIPPGGSGGLSTTNWMRVTVSGTKNGGVYVSGALSHTNGIVQALAGTSWSQTNLTVAGSPGGAVNLFQYRGLDSTLQTFSIQTTAVRLVSYLVPPVVDITNQILETAGFSIHLGGTNAGAVVGTMTWYNARTREQGTFAAATPWSSPAIRLEEGENRVTVSGPNATGVTGSDSVVVTRLPEAAGATLIHYVSLSGSSVVPYTNWATAVRIVQDAADIAQAGDTVLVSNGTYSAGGRALPGYGLTNRILLTKAVTIRGVNGANYTTIAGGGDGDTAVRCAYLYPGARLEGLRLSGGRTRTKWPNPADRSGGGAYLFGGGVLSSCIVSYCSAATNGGGVYCRYGGSLEACTVTSCSATNMGGGVYFQQGGRMAGGLIMGNSAYHGGGVCFAEGGSVSRARFFQNSAILSPYSEGGGAYIDGAGMVDNSVFYRNNSRYGGGISAHGGLVRNCTLVSNSVNTAGGGVYGWLGGAFENCIIRFNITGGICSNWYAAGDVYFDHCCMAPSPCAGMTVTHDP
ncbi:MAG: choice-of-anchor Q domain-containing protein, partial [bacterium]